MTDIQTTTFTPQGPAKLTFLCPNELVLWLERWAQVRSQTVPEVLCDLVSAAVGHNRPADTEQPDPRQDAIGVIRLARSLLDGFPAYDTPTQPENAIKKNTHPGYTWIAFRCARAVYDELEKRCRRHEKRGETRSVPEAITALVASMLAVRIDSQAGEIVTANHALKTAGETPQGVLDAYKAKMAADSGKDG